MPGESCTQYSESGLDNNLYHVRIASYLSVARCSVSLKETCAHILNAPWLNLISLEVPEDAPVVIIPSHLDKFANLMFEDGRIVSVRGEQSVCLSRGMCRDRNSGEKLVRFGVKLF